MLIWFSDNTILLSLRFCNLDATLDQGIIKSIQRPLAQFTSSRSTIKFDRLVVNQTIWYHQDTCSHLGTFFCGQIIIWCISTTSDRLLCDRMEHPDICDIWFIGEFDLVASNIICRYNRKCSIFATRYRYCTFEFGWLGDTKHSLTNQKVNK